jgi:hypothetical protein
MAKLTGPLFSLEASGTVGRTITYSRWKGRAYSRRRVIPLNPMSANQVASRNLVRAASQAVSWASQTALKTTPPGVTDKAAVAAITPDTQAWNGYLLASIIGANAINANAAQAIWSALQAGEKTSWNNAAAALVPPILPCAQGDTGGGYTTDMPAGEILLMHRYGLYALGLVGIPTATPPTYA